MRASTYNGLLGNILTFFRQKRNPHSKYGRQEETEVWKNIELTIRTTPGCLNVLNSPLWSCLSVGFFPQKKITAKIDTFAIKHKSLPGAHMQVYGYANKFIIALPLRRFLFGPSSSSSSVTVSMSCSLRSISLLSVLVSRSSRSSSLTQQNKQKVTN